jgi:hypothetical protein
MGTNAEPRKKRPAAQTSHHDPKNLFGLLWRIYQSLSPWVLFGLLCLLTVVAFSFLSAYDVKYENGKVAVEPKSNRVLDNAVFRGFYIDYDPGTSDNRGFYIASEDMSLVFYQSGAVAGRSKGPTRLKRQERMTEWSISGYLSGEYTFMSYITSREDDKPSIAPGTGTYILHHVGGLFTGYLIFHSSFDNKDFECPYILTRDMQLSRDEARIRWPMLDPKRGCKEVLFINPIAQDLSGTP